MSIVVVGSSNTDMVVQSAKLPAPGETVLGGDLLMNPGGKGANQAVAAAKLGGDVVFIARVGNDMFGQEAVKGFADVGIDTRFIVKDPDRPSGVALIMVDDKGENSISVALGANGGMTQGDLDAASSIIKGASYVLVQLEIPLPAVSHLVQLANTFHTPVVLNPAPACPLPDELLRGISIITPNASETSLLTGVHITDEDLVRDAARMLRKKEINQVVITLGSRGSYILSDEVDEFVGAPAVSAVDTTAAGDTFNGALVVGLSEGMKLSEAVQFANRAAAISVTRRGAQASVPWRKEVSFPDV